MTFECRVQGEFDKVLAAVEDRILSTAEDIKKIGESSAIESGYRSVVRVYNRKAARSRVDVNLILVQTGSKINISVTTSVGSGSDFDEEDFINNIKRAVNNYASLSIKEEVSEVGDESEPLIILTSREYSLYKDELFKSTFDHAGENTKSSNNKWEPGFIREIKDALAKKGINTNHRYSYLLGIYGLFPMIMGGGLLFLIINGIISWGYEFSVQGFLVFFVALSLFLFGLVLVLGPTQTLVFRRFWNSDTSKYRGWSATGIQNSNGIRLDAYSQMLLYENNMKIYLQGKLVSFDYDNMECIFETENWFVIMVEDRDIFTFAKCDISESEEELVRKILTPYYERRYKIVESEDSLFKDM